MVIVLIVDQVSKYFAIQTTGFTINTGISFNLFASAGITIALIIAYVLFFEWSCSRWQEKYPIAMGLVLGGGLSNLVDRVVYGGVRDFLPVPFIGVVNNLADWMIVVGLLLILIKELQTKQIK